jgi:broad specificity phosphatase PhoE
MKLFLIRHGQSQSNENLQIHQSIPDHAIKLTNKGENQAKVCGEFLAKYFEYEAYRYNSRIWKSPYLRTRQTKDIINKEIEKNNGLEFDSYENVLLAEQQFGLFDGLADDELKQKFPEEHTYYELCQKFQGRFWARMPLGESRFDVATRVHQIFGTWQRDKKKHGIENLFVVAHGTTIRAIVMQWLHLPFEWFESELNPNNCSVRLIEDNIDKGYIFKGFDREGNLVK